MRCDRLSDEDTVLAEFSINYREIQLVVNCFLPRMYVHTNIVLATVTALITD